MNYIPKAGHFVLFLSLGLCLAAISLTDKKKILLMDIICFAGVTELMQMLIEGRTPLLKDCFLMFLEVSLGSCFFCHFFEEGPS